MSLEHEVNRISSPDCYLVSLARELKEKRDFMAKFISEIGMVPIIPEGGYFMIIDWTPLSEYFIYSKPPCTQSCSFLIFS